MVKWYKSRGIKAQEDVIEILRKKIEILVRLEIIKKEESQVTC